MLKSFPEVLSVSGAGRNVGKTTLICQLIQRYASQHPVAAIKISPHFHKVEGLELIGEAPGQFSIYNEVNPGTAKDSSRMLKAGASPVFYVQAVESEMLKAFNECMALVPHGRPVICENGSLTKYIDPGLSLFLMSAGLLNQTKKPGKNAIRIMNKGVDYHEPISRILWRDNTWKYKQ